MTFLKKKLTLWSDYFFVALFVIPFVGVFVYNLYLTTMSVVQSLEITHFNWMMMFFLAACMVMASIFVLSIIKLLFDELFRGGVQGQRYFYRAVELTSGKDKNYEKAIELFAKAAQRGLAQAQHNLGVAYYNGYGVTKDTKEAVRWYTRAAKQGFAQAQFCLGVMYHNGYGVTQNYAEAVRWFTKADRQGLAEAQKALSEINKTS